MRGIGGGDWKIQRGIRGGFYIICRSNDKPRVSQFKIDCVRMPDRKFAKVTNYKR